MNYAPKLDAQTCERYLKMLAQALGELSRNQGAQRKEIWKYLMDTFDPSLVEYQTFLIAIGQLIKGEKLKKNDNGFYWIQKDIYYELHKNSKEGKSSILGG